MVDEVGAAAAADNDVPKKADVYVVGTAPLAAYDGGDAEDEADTPQPGCGELIFGVSHISQRGSSPAADAGSEMLDGVADVGRRMKRRDTEIEGEEEQRSEAQFRGKSNTVRQAFTIASKRNIAFQSLPATRLRSRGLALPKAPWACRALPPSPEVAIRRRRRTKEQQQQQQTQVPTCTGYPRGGTPARKTSTPTRRRSRGAEAREASIRMAVAMGTPRATTTETA